MTDNAETLTTTQPVETPEAVETEVSTSTPVAEAAETPNADNETPADSGNEDNASPSRIVPAVDEYVLAEGVPKYMAEFAHENDMTQDQLDSALKKYGEINQAGQTAQFDAIKQEGLKYVEAWGEHKETNLNLVQRALAENDPDGAMTKVLNETGYGNHPAVLDMFLKVGKMMQEGNFLKSAVNVPAPKKSAAQVLYGTTHPSKFEGA